MFLMSEGNSLQDFLDEISLVVWDLRKLGFTIQDKDLTLHLLSILPPL